MIDLFKNEMSNMVNLANCLWHDEVGFVVSVELILISTVSVIGLIAGLSAIRTGIVSELSDVARSVQELNQSYRYNGETANSGETAGSGFVDATDASSNGGIAFDLEPANERTSRVRNPISISRVNRPDSGLATSF